MRKRSKEVFKEIVEEALDILDPEEWFFDWYTRYGEAMFNEILQANIDNNYLDDACFEIEKAIEDYNIVGDADYLSDAVTLTLERLSIELDN